MADGRDNVSVQPVPISNVGPKIQDRTYEVDAHTLQKLKQDPFIHHSMDTQLKSQH
jgi:hypothetical protein